MQKLIIKVHSIVDVITNSSTVIYTQADEGTIKSVKELINALLAIGKSELTADDLFEFSLEKDDESYSDYGYSNVELAVSCKSDNEHAITAVKILNRLDSLFNHEAEYDG